MVAGEVGHREGKDRHPYDLSPKVRKLDAISSHLSAFLDLELQYSRLWM